MKKRRTHWTKEQAETFGRRLRQLREERGLSQREVAFDGCTAAYISRVEKGERYPSVVLIRGLAERLDVTAEFLEFGTDSRAMSDVLFDRLLERTEGPTCIALRRRDSAAVELHFALDGTHRRAAGASLYAALEQAVRLAAERDALQARIAEIDRETVRA